MTKNNVGEPCLMEHSVARHAARQNMRYYVQEEKNVCAHTVVMLLNRLDELDPPPSAEPDEVASDMTTREGRANFRRAIGWGLAMRLDGEKEAIPLNPQLVLELLDRLDELDPSPQSVSKPDRTRAERDALIQADLMAVWVKLDRMADTWKRISEAFARDPQG